MRKLKLHIKDKDYTLEMDRNSIKWLESMGFNIEELAQKPLTSFDILWTSLFIKNHKDVNPNLALKLADTYSEEKGNNMYTKVVKFAVEEYKSFMNALADIDSEEKDEKLEIIE